MTDLNTFPTLAGDVLIDLLWWLGWSRRSQSAEDEVFRGSYFDHSPKLNSRYLGGLL